MTVQEHLDQARHNEDLAQKLGSRPLEAYDWAITVLFYSLLHFVDAYLLDRHNLTPGGHTAMWKKGQRLPGRNDLVRQYLPQIYNEYKILYDASRLARYEGAYRSSNSAGDHQNLKDNEFAAARGFFRQLGW
jgi:hypothetical protein